MDNESKCFVGRTGEADRFQVDTLEQAENVSAVIAELDPAGVEAGEYYIDGPGEV